MRSNEVELNKEEKIAFDSKHIELESKFLFALKFCFFFFFCGKNQNLFMENYVENK